MKLNYLVVVFLMPTILFAKDKISTGFFSNEAISGYDSVSYFQNNDPVKGNENYKYKWKGATWLFKNEKNRDLFIKDPEKYAPKYGGYCAYAIANNYTASSDPLAWKIVDGDLYLNYSQSIKSKWENQQNRYIKQADKNWPEVLNQ